MANFPQDQFDEVPAELKRVGAHRAPRPRGRGAIAFAWAALATGVLVVAGLYGLSRLDPNFTFALPDFGGGGTVTRSRRRRPAPRRSRRSPIRPPSIPTLGLSISVFNGSAADGLQNTAGDAIAAAGWPDPARANADQRDEETTVIYYRSTEFEGIALGLAQLLGVGTIQLSDAFLGAPVTIVVGADYATVAGAGG